MKDLNEISVFVCVARQGSFTAAAKILGMPVSSVSRKVAQLEKRLASVLMQRTTRQISLTAAGESYLQECGSLLDSLEEAESRVLKDRNEAQGRIRLSVPMGLAGQGFTQLLSDFAQKNPGVSFELVVTNEYIDLVKESIDLTLRFGEMTDSSLIVRRLGASTRSLVAAPSYLKRNEPLKTPADLKKHKCLVYRGKFEELDWKLNDGKKEVGVRVRPHFIANDMSVLHDFCQRGHGIAFLPSLYCAEAIQKGKLVQVLPLWSSGDAPAQIVLPPKRFLPERIRLLIKAIEEWDSPVWKKG